MPRICVEVVGRECSFCVEHDYCVAFEKLLGDLVSRCQISLDSESFVFISNDKPLSPSSRICEDASIKVVRLLRGGS